MLVLTHKRKLQLGARSIHVLTCIKFVCGSDYQSVQMRTTLCVKTQLDPSKDLVLDTSGTLLDSIQGVLTQNVDPYACLRPMDYSLFMCFGKGKCIWRVLSRFP